MDPIYLLAARFFGKNYLHSWFTRNTMKDPYTMPGNSKYQATKRGHLHKHGLSRGQRNHIEFISTFR